jgi:hypothetical protein
VKTRFWMGKETLLKSRSRLRSSSLVTKYRALPPIAASTMWSSSGSRHICSSPVVCTIVARAAINRTNASASRWGYRNRRTNRGLLRTSAISPSCESDVTTLNSSSPQAATTCPGGPFGLRKAETQTLVSSRAASGTAFGLDLGSRSSHFRFNSLLRSRFSTSFHSPQHAFKLVSPPALGVKSDQDAGMFLQPKGSQRFQYTFLIHGSNRLFDRMKFFWQRHKADYTGPS